MAIRVLGDGCEICNPNYTIEILYDEIADLRARCEKAESVLLKIATVNAMDYEYNRWAKEHIAAIAKERTA